MPLLAVRRYLSQVDERRPRKNSRGKRLGPRDQKASLHLTLWQSWDSAGSLLFAVDHNWRWAHRVKVGQEFKKLLIILCACAAHEGSAVQCVESSGRLRQYLGVRPASDTDCLRLARWGGRWQRARRRAFHDETGSQDTCGMYLLPPQVRCASVVLINPKATRRPALATSHALMMGVRLLAIADSFVSPPATPPSLHRPDIVLLPPLSRPELSITYFTYPPSLTRLLPDRADSPSPSQVPA
ncbi:hypothetical protein QBC34DRAFT_130726 [Podospora aff. communis PSN243]|uniref:Uncharacterized protein n=1 Tax=Podospora aff. communis PSN243 TaxID=3040156 RepID=A0AAV9GHX9_9PEZI|nr:hypothetical protein QBC34DRAFT_130726 [Podospora aff. communis PSN243]